MQDPAQARFTTAFFLFLLVLGVTSIWNYFYFRRKSPAVKQKWLPLQAIGGAVFFVVFMLVAGFPLRMLLFAVPALSLITYLNLRFTKVCPNCGRTIYNNRWWLQPIEHCPYCGIKISRF